MKPTNHLRFVQRSVPTIEEHTKKQTRVLQQWWAFHPDDELEWSARINGEWRDVHMEIE